jgi:hypothetical protein
MVAEVVMGPLRTVMSMYLMAPAEPANQIAAAPGRIAIDDAMGRDEPEVTYEEAQPASAGRSGAR